MSAVAIKLRPVVAFREFPFGTVGDPSMREYMAPAGDEHEADNVAYLRSGHVLGYPMNADLPDWFDATRRANPLIGGNPLGGVTPMTDGVWVWPAGLICFVERYHVALPDEFRRHAAEHDWLIHKRAVEQGRYDYEY